MSWRLFTDRGRQMWRWISNVPPPSGIEYDSQTHNSADKVYRRQMEVQNFKPLHIDEKDFDRLKIPTIDDKMGADCLLAAIKGMNYYKSLQMEDGHWAGDYGGPMFLMPGAIIVSHVTSTPFTDDQKREMIRYLFNHQMADGGWGIHIEEKSTMFGTVLTYVSLRLLGIQRDDPRIQEAKKFIKREGGAMFAPSWAKFWLCVAGLLPWEGVNSLFPELWMLPEFLPFHPWRWWCHCFPESDTRVMTDNGFLSLAEIDSLGAANMKFACYDKRQKMLVYSTGRLIVQEAMTREIVNFTNEAEQGMWDADSDPYGRGRKGSARSNHLSIRVTDGHEMFVQRNGKKGDFFGEKVVARDLVEPPCDCVDDNCEHRRSDIRFLAVPTMGIRQPADRVPEFVTALGLATDLQKDAYLSLYGFWLKDGMLQYGGSGGDDAVRFHQREDGDNVWLKEQLGRSGLTEGVDWVRDDHQVTLVTDSRWFAFFNAEYGLKQGESAKRFAPWVRRDLDRSQCRVVLDGLRRAGGDEDRMVIYTSDVCFRDDIVQLALHAGYAAYFECSQKVATTDRWSVVYTEPTTKTGKLQSYPQIKTHHVQKELYHGRVWCVEVDHPDQLIIAQRVHYHEGVVTKASRPVVVGNCRMVYLPMSYCYANRVTGPITPVIQQLREELYNEPFDKINFTKHRDSISKIDLYTPPTWLLKGLNFTVNVYERFAIPWIRKKASDFLSSYIQAEDEQTKYIDIGPVNKFVNMLSVWHRKGPNSEEFKLHADRVIDYLWVSEDGMKVGGYNGSQLWDTAFSIQAMLETGVSHLFSPTMNLAYHYLEIAQVAEDVPQRAKFYRHISKGGWPFSTRDHGWPISDCTAEGVKATIGLHMSAKDGVLTTEPVITPDRLQDAINVLLSFQNKDGGWATYELQRGGGWLEMINPAEVFGGIMVDYPYVECSSASLQALCKFREQKEFATHRRAEIDDSIEKAVKFMKSIQRADGSWYGSWAVCFTYGMWFGVEGLIAAGVPPTDVSIQKAVAFLLSKQNPDGGWGESYQSCVQKVYVPHARSQSVNTAWALLALMKAEANRSAIKKGIEYLLRKQKENGDWDQESISGVFNGNCMISYSNYRNIFPIWALGRYVQLKRKEQGKK